MSEPLKFRKKPVVIEAFQLTETNRREILQWAKSYAPLGTLIGAVPKSGHPHQMLVHTLEGTMTANVGDYIIRGVQGEFYPCKPDIFEQTYEDAELPVQPIQAIVSKQQLMDQPIGIIVRGFDGTVGRRATEERGVVFGDERTFSWEVMPLPALIMPLPEVSA